MTSKPLGLYRNWKPGEHVSLIGLTGSGKSTLGSRLLDLRRYVVIFRTKSDSVKYQGTRVVRTAAGLDDPRYDRFELKPQYERQALECQRGLDKVWRAGGFTCYIDELFYVDQELGCRPFINRIATQGRDPGGISLVCAMQRPVSVTRFAVGESTHVFSFGLEGRDAKIVGETTSPRLSKLVTELGPHEFAHYYVPDRSMFRGKLNLKTGQIEGEQVA